MKIILGSASAGRKLIMEELGYDFVVMPADIDEKAIRRDDPQELVMAIANAKADALLPHIHEPALLITSDQVVLFKGVVHEKPVDAAEAKRFLASYVDAPVEVSGAIVVVNTATGKRVQAPQSAKVSLKPMPEDFIETYVRSGEALKGAGGFTIQNPIFEPYIERVEGAFDCLVGLSKEVLQQLMREAVQ